MSVPRSFAGSRRSPDGGNATAPGTFPRMSGGSRLQVSNFRVLHFSFFMVHICNSSIRSCGAHLGSRYTRAHARPHARTPARTQVTPHTSSRKEPTINFELLKFTHKAPADAHAHHAPTHPRTPTQSFTHARMFSKVAYLCTCGLTRRFSPFFPPIPFPIPIPNPNNPNPNPKGCFCCPDIVRAWQQCRKHGCK